MPRRSRTTSGHWPFAWRDCLPSTRTLSSAETIWLRSTLRKSDWTRSYEHWQQVAQIVERRARHSNADVGQRLASTGKQLLIVPSGALAQLPFQVLVTAEPKDKGASPHGSREATPSPSCPPLSR